MLSDLEALLAALPDKRKCADVHSMKREGCPECEADDMRGRTAARRKLEAQAPALAQRVLDLREAGEALFVALQRSRERDMFGACTEWCEVHKAKANRERHHADRCSASTHSGDCRFTPQPNRDKALASWAELTRTEERDGT